MTADQVLEGGCDNAYVGNIYPAPSRPQSAHPHIINLFLALCLSRKGRTPILFFKSVGEEEIAK